MKTTLLTGICAVSLCWSAWANDSFYPPQPAAWAAMNFDGRGFIINGQRTFIASGSIRYPRVPQALWHDRLLRLKRAGLNCVQTYTFMNYHSPQEGVYDFSGEKDFNLYLKDAHDLGLYATVRAGLYVCAEWENGGYPDWLLQEPGMGLRQSNTLFYAASDEWYAHILPIVFSNQINHGGSVILVQLENEHPSLAGTDTSIPPLDYFNHLRTNALSLGIEVPMFFSGVHHGGDPTTTISPNPWDSVGRDTPWYTTEFWAGWFSQYGNNQGQAGSDDRINWKMIAYGGNGYNYYMFCGGSNFDHWNDDSTAASYDYGAALGQAGDFRTLYYRDKRAATFARTFQAILENSTNASSTYATVASNVSAITARGSPAGTILFLDNSSGGTATAVLTNGAQMTLESGEIAPVVKNFALTSWLIIQEADSRIFGAQPQGNLTSLVLYGLPGETVRVNFSVTSGLVTYADAAFATNAINPASVVFSTPVVDGTPSAYTLSAGTNSLRVLVASKTMVDRTWFVDSVGTNYVVSGPAYVGEFTNAGGQIICNLEEPVGSPLPTNILVYGGEQLTAHALTITNQVSSSPLIAPPLVNWKMRLAANPAAANFDDSTWFSASTPPLMGADGDSSNYAWYRAKINVTTGGSYFLTFAGINDWGTLFVNGQQVAMQPVGPSFTVPVTLQAGTNTLAVFTSHYGRNKLWAVAGTSSTTFTPKGMLGLVSVSAQNASSASLTNWYWINTGSNTVPSAATVAQITATNYDPVANGWSTGANWNGNVFGSSAGYAWFRAALPSLAGGTHSVHFVNVDDNCTVYLNGTNIVATHNGYGAAFDVSLDAYWQANGTNILTVLVQNTGGPGGINGAVTLNVAGVSISNWKMQGGLGTIDGAGISWQPLAPANGLPVFYRATFQYQPPAGVLPILRTAFSGLSHGFIWLNGHNLGRFPEVIPTKGIYLPECWLSQTNELVVFDEQGNAPSEVVLMVETAASRQLLQCADVNNAVVYPPASVVPTAGNTQVLLNWSAVAGASGYNVKRALISGGYYTIIATNLAALTLTDTGLANSTTYYYVVSAVNGGNETPNSPEQIVIPNPPPPSAPVGVTAISGDSQATLAWNATSGATGYCVLRSSTSGGPYILIATNVAGLTFLDTGLVDGKQYYYVVTAVNTYGGSANSAEVGAVPLALGTLNGAIIGSSGTYGGGNTINHVFDGSLGTYYDAADASDDWAGQDFGTSNIITQIWYCPRTGYPTRMVNGVFQADNNSDFTSAVTLFTITVAPQQGALALQTISNTNPFRYARYVGPANANCNVAEVEFHGYSQAPPAPSWLTASASNRQAILNWNSIPIATGYNLKRSQTSGAGYSIIASNLTSVAFTDTGLNNGTVYYYTVSAINLFGEGGNSVEASAQPVSMAPPQLGVAVNGGQILLAWPVDHKGWLLQSQTNSMNTGLGMNWVTLANSSFTNQVAVPIGSTNGSVFFRLIYP